MKKHKFNFLEFLLCVVIGLLICLLLNNKNILLSNNIENSYERETETEIEKYHDMLNSESVEDIETFLTDKTAIGMNTKVLNYIIDKKWNDASDSEKLYFYGLHHDNITGLASSYNEILDFTRYTELLNEYDEEGIDFSKLSDIEKIDNYALRSILEEMYYNELYISMVNKYAEVSYKNTSLLKTMDKKLSNDYKKLLNIDNEVANYVLYPGRTEVDVDLIGKALLKYKDLAETTEDVYVAKAAVIAFNNYLSAYFGETSTSLFYSVDGTYTVQSDFTNSYKNFIKENPDNDLCDLLNNILDIIEKDEGKGTYIQLEDDMYNAKYEYMTSKGWQDTSDENTYTADDTNGSTVDILNDGN